MRNDKEREEYKAAFELLDKDGKAEFTTGEHGVFMRMLGDESSLTIRAPAK